MRILSSLCNFPVNLNLFQLKKEKIKISQSVLLFSFKKRIQHSAWVLEHTYLQEHPEVQVSLSLPAFPVGPVDKREKIPIEAYYLNSMAV